MLRAKSRKFSLSAIVTQNAGLPGAATRTVNVVGGSGGESSRTDVAMDTSVGRGTLWFPGWPVHAAGSNVAITITSARTKVLVGREAQPPSCWLLGSAARDRVSDCRSRANRDVRDATSEMTRKGANSGRPDVGSNSTASIRLRRCSGSPPMLCPVETIGPAFDNVDPFEVSRYRRSRLVHAWLILTSLHPIYPLDPGLTGISVHQCRT